MKVEDIALTHSGDKGDNAAVNVFVYDEKDWPLLRDKLTVEALKARCGDLVKGDIIRYELPTLHGLNFEMTKALDGGYSSSSLRLDGLGKTYQSLMLDIELD